jgi:hypothetical protein
MDTWMRKSGTCNAKYGWIRTIVGGHDAVCLLYCFALRAHFTGIMRAASITV